MKKFTQTIILFVSLFFVCSAIYSQAEVELDDSGTRQHVNATKSDQPLVQVYPNPFASKLTLQAAPGKKIKEVQIISLNGATVYRKKIGKENSFKIDLDSGNYYFRMRLSTGEWVTKAVKFE